ncbi:MAG: DUF4230 domain-containing protein [Verrucomicrobiia bacterium]
MIKFYTVSAIILAFAVVAFYFWAKASGSGAARVTFEPASIVLQIQQLNQLVVVKYTLQQVIEMEQSRPLYGNEKLLLLVQGKVLGGIDLSRLTPQDVQVGTDKKSVTVSLPPPRILEAFLDEKETRVWNNITWWTPWIAPNPDLQKDARLLALDKVKAAAREMGILADAQRNAETSIRGLLMALGFETVKFVPHTAAVP